MKFLPALANEQDYPASTILARPSMLSAPSCSGIELPLPQYAKRLGMFNRARTSLYVIAQSLPDAVIWLPSYHCPALVEPFIQSEKHIRFYPVNRLLRADLKFLAQHINQGEVVLGIRYFGFDCGIKELADFCKGNKLLLIEDLAHAAFSKTLYGDLAVTSLTKLYPTDSGSDLLYHQEKPDNSKLNEQAKSLPRYWTYTLNKIKRKLLQELFREIPKAKITTNMYRGISERSKRRLSACKPEEIIKNRVKNYNYLCSRLIKSTLGHVLLPDLHVDTTPYVLPFLLNHRSAFDHIRNTGIQIYRWEEMVDSGCDTCRNYRDLLIQLPCHQDLTSGELQKIVDTLTESKQ